MIPPSRVPIQARYFISAVPFRYPKRHSHISHRLKSICQSVADHGIHFVVACAETSQLDFFSILDFLCIAVTPFYGNIGVSIGIYKDIKGAIPVEDW